MRCRYLNRWWYVSVKLSDINSDGKNHQRYSILDIVLIVTIYRTLDDRSWSLWCSNRNIVGAGGWLGVRGGGWESCQYLGCCCPASFYKWYLLCWKVGARLSWWSISIINNSSMSRNDKASNIFHISSKQFSPLYNWIMMLLVMLFYI